jgi:NAD(P)H dehydrogenase (quinone)
VRAGDLQRAVAEGARAVPGASVVVKRVAETLPDDVLEMMGAKAAQGAFAQIPVASVDDLANENELAAARFQGEHATKIEAKLRA